MQADKKQAAIYCRVASKDDFAIERQRQDLRRFAAAQGYEDCAEYLDNGVNGLTLDRPAFSRLHNDMIAGKIQVIFIVSASRIGRDLFATMKWLHEAKASGAEIISQH